MGYSLNLDAVIRVQRFLQTLLDSKEDEITWQTIEPKKFQYYLHTGLIAAAHIEHPEFKDLRAMWKIRMRGANVIASRKILTSPVAVIQVGQATTLYEVIQELSSTNNSMTFDSTLDDEELDKLKKWCAAKNATLAYKEGKLNVFR